MDLFAAIETERHRLADELETFTDEQWATQSQCEGWDVRHVAAHTVLPFNLTKPAFLMGIVRARFDFDRFFFAKTGQLAASMTTGEVIAQLRANADNRWTPPGPYGAEVPLTEIIVHGQDIRRPLGMACPVPDETIDVALRALKDDAMRANYAERIGVPVPV